MPTSLCIDCRMMFHSGIGTFLQNVVPFFVQDPSFAITVLLPRKKVQEIPWIEACQTVICDSSIYSIQEQFLLPLQIPSCDIFWSPHFNIPVLPIRARKRVVSIHDTYHLTFFTSLSLREKGYAKMMYSMAVSRSDQIVIHSEFIAKELQKHLSIERDRLKIISLGVDESYGSLMFKEGTQSLREKYSLPPSFFLFVGNIKSHKNLRVVLEALKLTQDASLVIVGKQKGLINVDPIFREIANDSLFRKKILFLENLETVELAQLYSMAEALVYPSLYEGFGLPPLEAMARSCPVIASRVASLPEVCGDAVHYIDPKDPRDVADAFRRMRTDLSWRQSLIEKGHSRIKNFLGGQPQKNIAIH